MLPEGVHIILEDQRDWDGYYSVESGRTLCFEFEVPEGETLNISMLHAAPAAQDHSIRCWFSNTANGALLFPYATKLNDAMDVFPMPRTFRTIELPSSTISEGKFALEPGRKYFLMVKNLQNALNHFRLEFNNQA